MIRITVNGAQFQKQLTGVAREQFPFAMANTLTSLGWEGVNENKEALPSRFTIRTTWVSRGYRVKKALKTRLVAEVSHKDAYMALQEFGGQKTPVTARSVADPVGARPTPQTTTPRSMWPGAILKKHSGFIIPNKGKLLVFERFTHTKKGKVRKNKRNRALAALPNKGNDPDIRLMYVLKPSVKVKPRLGLVSDIRKVINSHLSAIFNRELVNAIRTARPK